MKNLKHNQKVIINCRRGTICDLRVYMEESGDFSPEKIEEIMAEQGPAVWVNKESAYVCADPEYYANKAKIWAVAVEIRDGERVMVEGKEYTVKFMGDYSDMVHMV